MVKANDIDFLKKCGFLFPSNTTVLSLKPFLTHVRKHFNTRDNTLRDPLPPMLENIHQERLEQARTAYKDQVEKERQEAIDAELRSDLSEQIAESQALLAQRIGSRFRSSSQLDSREHEISATQGSISFTETSSEAPAISSVAPSVNSNVSTAPRISNSSSSSSTVPSPAIVHPQPLIQINSPHNAPVPQQPLVQNAPPQHNPPVPHQQHLVQNATVQYNVLQQPQHIQQLQITSPQHNAHSQQLLDNVIRNVQHIPPTEFPHTRPGLVTRHDQLFFAQLKQKLMTRASFRDAILGFDVDHINAVFLAFDEVAWEIRYADINYNVCSSISTVFGFNMDFTPERAADTASVLSFILLSVHQQIVSPGIICSAIKNLKRAYKDRNRRRVRASERKRQRTSDPEPESEND